MNQLLLQKKLAEGTGPCLNIGCREKAMNNGDQIRAGTDQRAGVIQGDAADGGAGDAEPVTFGQQTGFRESRASLGL